MDIFETPDYRISKFLLCCLGQWPYQTLWQKRLNRSLYWLSFVTVFIPQICYLVNVWGNLDLVVDCVSLLGTQVSTAVKVLIYIFNGDKMKTMLNRVARHWETNKFGSQMDILMSYTNEGRKLVEIYTAFLGVSLVLIVSMPLLPKFLDFVMPLNESRPTVYLLSTKYGDLQLEEHYFFIWLHANIAFTYMVIVVVATDAMYVNCIQHNCAMFAVLGNLLEGLMKGDPDVVEQGLIKIERQKEEATNRLLIKCIKLHMEAIEFAKEIDSTYGLLLFSSVGFGVLCLSFAGYQMMTNVDNLNEALRFASFTLSEIIHIFFISWPGQKLINYSEEIHYRAYEGKWYDSGARSKKLLIIIMHRSLEPCKITAAKLYVMSLTNFSTMVRAAVSYLTVLSSFR